MVADQSSTGERLRTRALRRLSQAPQKLEQAAKKESLLLFANDDPPAAFPVAVIEDLIRSGLVRKTNQGTLDLTDTGRAHVVRMQSRDAPFANQHRAIEPKEVSTSQGVETVLFNAAESPLALLARRKSKDGRPFLSGEEIEAGERLRRDYTYGQVVSETGVNLEARVGAGGKGGRRNTQADLTDTAVAARQRVDAALAAVGPELAGVLVDVCCFLKRLTIVETERQWPARSAKIVLKTALAALARHYVPGAANTGKQARVYRWGTADYRPQMRGK